MVLEVDELGGVGIAALVEVGARQGLDNESHQLHDLHLVLSRVMLLNPQYVLKVFAEVPEDTFLLQQLSHYTH